MSCHNIQRYSENDKHFPKTERRRRWVFEKRGIGVVSLLLWFLLRVRYNTGFQYTTWFSLDYIHAHIHTLTRAHRPRFTHMLWCCHGLMHWFFDGVCVMCQQVCTEGSPVREAFCSNSSLYTANTLTRCGLPASSSLDVIIVMATPREMGVKKDLRWHLNTNGNPRSRQLTAQKSRGSGHPAVLCRRRRDARWSNKVFNKDKKRSLSVWRQSSFLQHWSHCSVWTCIVKALSEATKDRGNEWCTPFGSKQAFGAKRAGGHEFLSKG